MFRCGRIKYHGPAMPVREEFHFSNLSRVGERLNLRMVIYVLWIYMTISIERTIKANKTACQQIILKNQDDTSNAKGAGTLA